MSFWFIAALLVLVALALVLWPLLRQPRKGAVAARTALLRDQLDALKAAHAAGLIDDATFASKQQALSAAALALIDTPEAAVAQTSKLAFTTAVFLTLAIPLATLYLYDEIGTPNALGFQGPSTGAVTTPSGEAATNNAPDLAKAAETLAAKMKERPDDGEGWALLARTYRAIERFPEANEAYTRARALLPEDPDLLAESAEAMGLSSNPRSLSGEPEKLIARALELDANNQNALFLQGLARAQADDPTGAEASWEKLLGIMEAGTPAQAAVVEQLNIVRERLGKAPMPTPTAASGPAQMAATPPTGAAPGTAPPDPNAAGIDVNVSIAPEVAAQISENDVLFVFARAEAGPPAPLAIQRRSAGELPLTLRLDESMGMIAGMSLAQFPKVIIGARISKSGNAQAQPGDIEGLSAALDWRAAGKVDIVISKVR